MGRFIKPLLETFVIIVAMILISVVALKYYAGDTLYKELDIALRNVNKRIDALVFASTVNLSNPVLKKGEIPNIIASNIAVFKFKDITPNPQAGHIDRMKFADFIRKLKEVGYETITYEEYKTASQNRQKLPANSIVLIFSGEKKETYDIVEPILNGVGYKATITYAGDEKINLERSVFMPKDYVDDLLATGNWSYVPDAVPNLIFYSSNTASDLISRINTSLNDHVTLAQNLDTINIGNNSVLAQVLGASVSVNENDREREQVIAESIEFDGQGSEIEADPVEANPEPKPQPVNSPRTHTVNIGDNLWNISQRYYGTGNRALEIARKNSIFFPNLIFPGQKLILP